MNFVSKVTTKPIISADSHITEPPEVFKNIGKKYADLAPRLVKAENGGDVFIIDGIKDPFPIMLAASAGIPALKLKDRAKDSFKDIYPGGVDPKARLKAQDQDGIAAEVIYPSLGLFLCNHADPGYKDACFASYNVWMAEFCSLSPNRLIGLGQTGMSSPEQGVEDLKKIKALGLKGVMLPGIPCQADYDHRMYDPVWEKAVELDLPLSFHILTYKDGITTARGPKVNNFMNTMRGNQDLIGVTIFGGVFDRVPELKMVCVEADAGWVPHYQYRMDHAMEKNGVLLGNWPLKRKPSEYFHDNIYVTFQDDHVAFRLMHMLNPKRMMWANDYPHMDSTWPDSQALLEKHTMRLTQEQRDDVLHNNCAELYKVTL